MSDSGKQIGECRHGNIREACECCILTAENARLKSEISLHRDKANGDYWAWQGDGHDYLESLVCPVVIPAAKLLGLLRGVGRAGAIAEQIGGTHYKDMAIQPVEFIHANGIGFFEGSAIAYLARWKVKGGVQDLLKAKHMVEMLIEFETKRDA